MDTATESQFLALARSVYPAEAVAFLVVERGKYRLYPCQNAAPDPNAGILTTAADWAAAEARGEIVAVVHSHPDADGRPSPQDLSAAAASGLAWIIAGFPDGVDGRVDWQKIDPARREIAPLYGRRFIHGLVDCWTFIKDWYHLERGIELIDGYRPDLWWERGLNLYVERYPEAGFRLVRAYPGDDLLRLVEVGDMLLISYASPVSNHAAVYLGENKVGHHLLGRLSSADMLSDYLIRRTTHLLRYEGRPHA